MRKNFCLRTAIACLLCGTLSGCETGSHSSAASVSLLRLGKPSITSGVPLFVRPLIKFKKPASSDTSFGVSYAQNALVFYQSLLSQFQANIAAAVTAGTLTSAQQTEILRAVGKRDRLLRSSLNRYLKRLGVPARRAVAIEATTIRLTFPSPFDPPVTKIPPQSNKTRLASIRTVLGQVESYSGLGVAFTQSLTSQITMTATSSQIALAQALDAKLVSSFKRDISAIRKLIQLVNVRRFKFANKKRISPAQFAGDYTGTCTNISNGRVENIAATVAYDESTGAFTLSFERPDNLFGTGATELFSSIYSSKRGVRFSDSLPLFGTTKVTISPRGYITGVIKAEPTAAIDRVDFWGVANTSDSTVLLDVRTDFPEYDEGGQAHMVMELAKL